MNWEEFVDRAVACVLASLWAIGFLVAALDPAVWYHLFRRDDRGKYTTLVRDRGKCRWVTKADLEDDNP